MVEPTPVEASSLTRLSRSLIEAINQTVPASTERYFVATSDLTTKTNFEQLRLKVDRITTKLINLIADPTQPDLGTSGWRATEDSLDRLFGLLDDSLRDAASEPAFLAKRRRLDSPDASPGLTGALAATPTLGGVNQARVDEERLTGRPVPVNLGLIDNPAVNDIDTWLNHELTLLNTTTATTTTTTTLTTTSDYISRVLSLPVPVEPVDEFTSITTDAELIAYFASKADSVLAMAVDLEHHNFFSYHGYTCLIQITLLCRSAPPSPDAKETDGGQACDKGELHNIIIDVLSEEMSFSAVGQVLGRLFGDWRVYKIFHGSEQDMQWLLRDFGLSVVNMFDTGVAARALSFPQKSLKAVIETYYPRVVLDKTHQLSDWRVRPLSNTMLQYAVSDTKYLIYVWKQMVRDLANLGSTPTTLTTTATTTSSTDIRGVSISRYGRTMLTQVLRESGQLSRKEYKAEFSVESAADKIIIRNGGRNDRELLVRVLRWRDRVARDMNINWGLVLKERDLVRLVGYLATGKRGCQDLVRGNFGAVVTERAEELWKEVIEVTVPLQSPAAVAVAAVASLAVATGGTNEGKKEFRLERAEVEKEVVVGTTEPEKRKRSKLVDSFM